MKKLISMLLLLTLIVSLASCGKSEANQLIVATEPGFAPYEYMKGNDIVGIDMDISKAIADKLGKELVVKEMDFNGALFAVQQGKVDMVAAGVSVTEERKLNMDFSTEYVDSTEVVVVNKSTPAVTASYNAAEEAYNIDLEGKLVGVQQGNLADFWVEENANAGEIRRYTKFSQAALELKNNKLDCIVMDLYPAMELVKSNEDLEILSVDGEMAVLFEDKYAIAVQKGNEELLKSINEVIDTLIKEGKIEEFTRNHTTQAE